MEWPARHDFQLVVRGHLEHDIVINEVQRVVQRVDGQVRRPAEADVLEPRGSLAIHGLPGLAFLASNDDVDDAVLVDHADVGAVGQVDLVVGRNRNALGVGQAGLQSMPFVPTLIRISRKASDSGSNDWFKVVLQVGWVDGVDQADDLVGLGVADVEDVLVGVEGHVVPVGHPGGLELQQCPHSAIRHDPPDEVEVPDVNRSVSSGNDADRRQQPLGSGLATVA